MEHSNQTLTKSMIFDSIWNDENSADDNTLNVHISKIKTKLKECNPKEEYIETVWSIGYRLKN
jgi:DNA-binding response OmpR family regulator